MKIGHISIEVRQYGDRRWGFDDYSSGTRVKVRLLTQKKAEARATDIAVLLANGRPDLLKADAAEWAQFRKWKSARDSSVSVAEACAEFLALKARKSSRHVASIKMDLAMFENFVGSAQSLGAITALNIQHFLNNRDVGERRKYNMRSTIVSMFRWARRMSHLDPDRMTEAEKVEPIELVPGQINVLSPAQMRTLLDNVREEFLPWLVIGAFAGVRSQEISPDYKSKKSPLKWEDFDWNRQVIRVRAETAKTKRVRLVPMLPNLAQWLERWRSGTGPVCPLRPCNHETRRLGILIGGWKHNALRDSYCSYRAVITQNIHQVSMEMGNSPAMVGRSYHFPQPIEIAQEWFDLRPSKDSNVVAFSEVA